MRPTILDPLFAPVSSLAGIGPKLEKALNRLFFGNEKADAARLVDLLFHIPHSIIDRRQQPAIADAIEGAIVTMKVWVDSHSPPPRGNRRVPYRVQVHDDSATMTLVFFHAHQAWIEKALPIGEMRYVSGKMEWYNDNPTMAHPDHVVSEAEFADMPLVEPIYGNTAGLSAKILMRSIHRTVGMLPEFDEWIDANLMVREDWPSFKQSLELVHHPSDGVDIAPQSPSRRRLAMDEFLAGQLALALMRAKMKKLHGKARTGSGELSAKLRTHLPYTLTGAQERSLKEITGDLAKPERMLRLLQGDVGSGKTVVALLAILNAIETGGQGAIMVPTEILARQHYSTLAPLCAEIGISIEVLSGKDKGVSRREIYGRLASGETRIIIGTHALFQDAVKFDDLRIAIIDEQHRFGVHQRLALGEKGEAVDILVMTATPIPRTLVLTYFGDMDVSQLDEKPPGRLPIQTNALPLERLSALIERIGTAVKTGQKVYWICPLVEESEELPLTAAQDRYETLVQQFGSGIGLVHGRMSSDEKSAAMQDFSDGTTKILVATTVIEVGVDVPDATIIVIEHAERFGLAQMHQLRGRVGRGDKASSCVLLYKGPLGEVAKARLNIMRETEDGFRIAEEDLKLRGEGEVLGTRQSGMPGFNLAEIEFHGDILEMARDQSRLIVETNPNLEKEQGEALRLLLYLFGQDDAIRLLRAG
ncbi:MAG: ATP-dependent DNA helicase RecG [Rhizobiaceae bacterium]|nr:ATP-dependent DNA helicase RecG [Rhizobiaceae bacterium]